MPSGWCSSPGRRGSIRRALPAPRSRRNSTSSGQTFERFSLLPVDNIVRITSYLRDASYAEANAQARVAALGGRLIPTTAIVAETLEADWLVEIEVIAAA